MPFPHGGVSLAEKDRAKIKRLYNRLKRMGYLPADAPGILALVDQAEASLFRSIPLNPAHVLRHLLPPTVQHANGLRPRPHNYVLPPKDDKNFIPATFINQHLKLSRP